MDQKTGSVRQRDSLDEMDTEMEETDIDRTHAQIEQTRAQMGGTLDAIKEKLNPQMLMQQAKETVHGVTADLAQQAKDTVHAVATDVAQKAKDTVHAVTTDVVQQAKDNLPQVTANAAHQAVSGAVAEAKEAMGSAMNTAKVAMGSAMNTAKETVSGAVDTARDAGFSVVEIIERNPLPLALIATGVGWLWLHSRRQSAASSYPERQYGDQNWRQNNPSVGNGTQATGGFSVGQSLDAARDKVGAVADQVQQQAGQIGTQLQDRAGRTVDGFQRLLQEHPLAVGAMALTLGAAAGLAVPETRPEQHLMGGARDRLADKVQHTVQEVGLKAQIVAEEALGAVKEEAKNQGFTK